MVKELFSLLGARPDGVCNFIDASKWFTDSPGARIVYRQYATLYFMIAIDGSESELGILDLIQVGPPPEASRRPAAAHQRCGLPRTEQVFVEVLDRHFKNVCELDIIFNVEQVHWVVDEMVVGGMVAETNIQDILAAIEDQTKLARQQGETGSGTQQGGPGPPSF